MIHVLKKRLCFEKMIKYILIYTFMSINLMSIIIIKNYYQNKTYPK